MAARGGYEVDGVRIAQARQALTGAAGKPMTQAELAESLGINRVTLTNIENGRAKVSLELLEALATKLSRSREHLLGAPETVDAIEEARAEIGEAVQKIADGFGELADVVDDLNEAARAAAHPVTA